MKKKKTKEKKESGYIKIEEAAKLMGGRQEEFRHMSDLLNEKIKICDDFNKKFGGIREAYNKEAGIAKKILDKYKNTFEEVAKLFKEQNLMFERIKKVAENNKKGKQIRGEIITSMISIDLIIEEIILKKYIKKEYTEEFSENFLNHRDCTSFLKREFLKKSGLFDQYPSLKTNIETLYSIRNSLAHSKYKLTVETVILLHKKKLTDIISLKKIFDGIYMDTFNKLDEILSKELKDEA